MIKKTFIPVWGLLALSISAFSSTLAAAEKNTAFFVSPSGNDKHSGSKEAPFASIERARDAVRAINQDMHSDIYVYLRGGQYSLDQTIEFNQQDSASNGKRIIYQAYQDETPVLTAGKKVNRWRPVKLNGHRVYRSKVKGIENFRQLYVDGQRAVRANSVNEVDLRANGIFSKFSDVYAYQAKDFLWEGDKEAGYILDKALFGDDLRNNDHFELVYRLNWRQHRIAADSVQDRGDGTVEFRVDPERMAIALTLDYPGGRPVPDKAFYVENAIGLLDYPGEWYFDQDKGYLYYYPLIGQDIDDVSVTVPTGLETLLAIQGQDLDNKVSGLTFDGLVFEYSTWLRPFTRGTSIVQANFYATERGQGSHTDGKNGTEITNGAQQATAAIDMSFAEQIKIQNSLVQHTGGTGIRLYNAVNDIEIINNDIKDISESGILLGTWLHNFIDQDDEAAVKNILIRNNRLTELGREYYSAPSIATYYTNSVTIEHNEILHSSYCAVCYGWNGWQGNKEQGISGEMDSITSRNTVIRYNLFEEYSEFMADVGGTYSLGQHPNSEIYGNYYKHGNNYNAIIYFDEGTAYATAYNNVINQRLQPHWNIHWYSAWTPSVHDNYIHSNYSNWQIAQTEGTRDIIRDNHFELRAGADYTKWSEEAQKIIDFAGNTERSYTPAKQHLPDDVAYNSNAKWLTRDNKLDRTSADFIAQYAVDGNPDSVARAADNNPLGILEIDLLAPYMVNRFAVDFKGDHYASKYQVLGSVDGFAFKPLQSVNNASASSEVSFATGEYRYIRLVPTSLNNDSMEVTGVAVLLDKKAIAPARAAAYSEKPAQQDLVLWVDGASAKSAGNLRVYQWQDVAGKYNFKVPVAFANLDPESNGDTNTRKKPQIVERVLNNRPAIRFDGWDDSLTTAVNGQFESSTLTYFAQTDTATDLNVFLDEQRLSPDKDVVSGEWALWTFVTSNGKTRVYKNAQLVDQQAAQQGHFSRLSISENRPIRDPATSYKITKANLAELALYKRALSAQEVEALVAFVQAKYAIDLE